MSDISKHVSMGRIYAACQMIEKLPGSETATAISILLSDAMRDIETLVDSRSNEIAAAVRAEREAIKAELSKRRLLSAERHWPLIHHLMSFIDSRPVHTVDVLGVVREYVEAYQSPIPLLEEFEEPDDEREAAEMRLARAWDALRALVDGAAAKGEGEGR